MCSMPRTTPVTPVLLQFNCGYARCAVKELTAQLAAGTVGKAAREVNRDKRSEMFRTLFHQPSFGIPEDFFTVTTVKRQPKFDDHCKAVLDAFASKWKSQCKHQEYLMTHTEMEKACSCRKGKAYTGEMCGLCNTACPAAGSISRANFQGRS